MSRRAWWSGAERQAKGNTRCREGPEVQGRPRGAGKAPPTASETGSSWSGDSREVSIERDPS